LPFIPHIKNSQFFSIQLLLSSLSLGCCDWGRWEGWGREGWGGDSSSVSSPSSSLSSPPPPNVTSLCPFGEGSRVGKRESQKKPQNKNQQVPKGWSNSFLLTPNFHNLIIKKTSVWCEQKDLFKNRGSCSCRAEGIGEKRAPRVRLLDSAA
jgi:hypothetical protein